MRLDVLLCDTAAIESLQLAIRLGQDLSRRIAPYFNESWQELESRAVSREFDVVIVQPSFPPSRSSGFSPIEQLSRVQSILGPGRLVLFVGDSRQDLSCRKAIAILPAPIVLVRGADDHPGSILRAVARSWSFQRLAPILNGSVGDGVPKLGTQEVVLALLVGWPPPAGVADVAKTLGLSPRTLRRRMEDGEAPSPRELVRWGRFLEALALRSMGIHSRARLASLLGLGRADALARLSKDLTGEPLETMLRPEKEESVLRILVRRLNGT